jgi:hypothetical protein
MPEIIAGSCQSQQMIENTEEILVFLARAAGLEYNKVTSYAAAYFNHGARASLFSFLIS